MIETMPSENASAVERDVTRYADVQPQPWANGNGVTRVLAVGRFDSSASEFDWRLSVADVTSGQFSKMPGIDRITTSCEGAGPTLTVDGSVVALVPFRPHVFAGESDTWCDTGQPTRNFNVMTRRDDCTASVDVHAAACRVTVPMGVRTYVVTLMGSATVRLPDEDRDVTLHRYDTILLTADAMLRLDTGSRAAVVRIGDRGAGSGRV
jgi:environmental stress-induced protein Ves